MSGSAKETFSLVWALVVCFTGIGNAFLMDDVSMVEPPCFYGASTFYCHGYQLTEIPKFLASTSSPPTLSILYIRLESNDIVDVVSGAFANLTLTNASDIRIFLYNNKINTIHDDGFIGIGHAVTHLELQNNNLSHIPDAFASLTSLKTLRLDNNPLLSMSSSSIYTLGRTVTSLSIGMNMFTEWPEEMNSFQALDTLVIYGYLFSFLPIDAMQGLHTTLTELSFEAASQKMPSAVCQLEKLERLKYIGNTGAEDPIFQGCDGQMTTVVALFLQSNNLVNFPDVLKYFPSLEFLRLSYNNISTIDSSHIPSGYPLNNLQLYYNDLCSIPRAIVHFQKLQVLFLGNNGIKSIEDNSLEGLGELRHLDLSDNPLEYVARTAFQSQQYLTQLELRNTKLRTIPVAVTALSYISHFYLYNAPIDCSCELSYLKTWYTNQTTIHGTCVNTHEAIGTYLENNLSQC